jgi:hypothetical protein
VLSVTGGRNGDVSHREHRDHGVRQRCGARWPGLRRGMDREESTKTNAVRWVALVFVLSSRSIRRPKA